MNQTRGLFISLEGIDGSGKSTQAKLLHNHLRAMGHDALLTREPGGSDGAEDIRRLLVEGDPGRWSAETEILLFTAARRDHLERLIEPNLAKGRHVITDRFADSTRVYQGAVRANLLPTVNTLHEAMIGIEPDITIIVDIDPQIALTRGLARQSGEDRFEEMGLAFQIALREGFQALAIAEPGRCTLFDGGQDTTTLAAQIAAHIDSRLNG
jgi:dTMP kinase